MFTSLFPHKSYLLHIWTLIGPHCVTLCVCVCVSRGGGGGGKWQGVSPCNLPHKGPSAQPASSLRWGSAELCLACLACCVSNPQLASGLTWTRASALSCFKCSLTTKLSLLICSWYWLCLVKTHIKTQGQQKANFLHFQTEECWRICLVDQMYAPLTCFSYVFC